MRVSVRTAQTTVRRAVAGVVASLTLLIMMAAAAEDVHAQQPPSPCVGGQTYYIAFPDTVTNTQDPRFPDRTPESISLMIYSPVAQSVALTRGTWVKAVSLNAGEMVEVTLSGLGENTPLVTTRNRPDDRVVRVQAPTPIIVYAVMSTDFGTAAFTPLPVESWGEEYYAATWPAGIVRNVHPGGETNYDASEKVQAPAEIMIIAAYDDTQVILSSRDELADCNGCTRVVLNRGEAYIVQSTVDLRDEAEDQPDLAGTYIQASRPIGVVSANTRTSIGVLSLPMLAGNSPKDMVAEWLRPVGQHGTTFPHMPVMDQLRQRPNVDLVRDAEYLRMYPTAEEETEFTLRVNEGTTVTIEDSPSDPEDVVEWHIGNLTRAYAVNSTAPAQVFQGVPSVAEFNGTTGSGNFIGAIYKSWGSAMVEVIPRERWTSFAPWRAPARPSDVQCYINIVTDSAGISNIFYRQGTSPRTMIVGWNSIAGTDMVWTSMHVDGGTTYIFEGDDGARFGGYAYGTREGYELYRPGGIEGEKGAGSSAAHPAEYEEGVAGAWALPFPSSTCSNDAPGDYIIDTLDMGCSEITLRLRRRDGSPLNLQYLALVAAETENVRLELISPEEFAQIDEATEAIVRLALINPNRGGKFVLEFRDNVRGGEITRVEHVFGTQDYLTPDATILRFMDVTGPTEESILLTNRTLRPISLQSLALAFGEEFEITRTSPEIPWNDPNRFTTVAPGESIRVWVRYTPSDQRVAGDTLIVALECGRMTIPVIGTTAEACIFVGDLSFGNVPMGASKTLPLQICNNGSGVATFESTTPLSWQLPEFFRVSEADLDALRSASLGGGECITINVTFSSQELIGSFRSVARFWASTRKCRDTSIWRADVGISSVGGNGDASGYRLLSLSPNPSLGDLTVSYEIPDAGRTTITLIDPSGREVRSLLAEEQQQGMHRRTFNLEGLPSGIYFVRIRSGAWEMVEGVNVVR